MSASWHRTPTSPKPYMLTFPTAALEQSLRAIWDAASWAAVLVLPQIKLNSQLSSSTFFLVNRLKAGGEGDDRGWDGWMALPTQWTWVSVNSGSWWWTERPGVLQSMESQSRTQLSGWTELNFFFSFFLLTLHKGTEKLWMSQLSITFKCP